MFNVYILCGIVAFIVIAACICVSLSRCDRGIAVQLCALCYYPLYVYDEITEYKVQQV